MRNVSYARVILLIVAVAGIFVMIGFSSNDVAGKAYGKLVLKPEGPITCYDSDTGTVVTPEWSADVPTFSWDDMYALQGSTILRAENGVPMGFARDSCLNEDVLIEKYCGSNSVISSISFNCRTSNNIVRRCQQGRCVFNAYLFPS